MKKVFLLFSLLGFILFAASQTATTVPNFSQTYPSSFVAEFILKTNDTAYAFQLFPVAALSVDLVAFYNATNGYTEEGYDSYTQYYNFDTINNGNYKNNEGSEIPSTAAFYSSSKNESNSGVYIGGTTFMLHYDTSFVFRRSVFVSENFAPYTSFIDQTTGKAYVPNAGGFVLFEFDLESFNATTTKNFTMPLSQVSFSLYSQQTRSAWLFNQAGDVALFDTNANDFTGFTDNIGNSTSLYTFKSAEIDYDKNRMYVISLKDYGTSNQLPYLTIYDIHQNGTNTTLTFVRETRLSDTPDVSPASIQLDLHGGQAFVGLVDFNSATATWSRIDLNDYSVLENSIYITNGRIPVAFEISSGDLFNQTVAVMTESGVNMFTYPTSCENDCTNLADPQQGYCDFGTCVCASGYTGTDCSQIACSNDCGAADGRGSCNNGVCLCGADWTGDNCTERRCPLGCSSNGECNVSQNYTCACNFRWEGSGCDVPRILTCEEVPEASECTGRVGECGWCHSSSKCMAGNSVGPVHGACADWFAESPKDIGIMAFAIIYIIICGILVLINIISAAVIDFSNSTELNNTKRLASDTIRRNWWRDERSNMGWALFEQLQFISLYAVVTVSFPTRILSFTRYFDWTCFILPLPGYFDNEYHPERSTARTTLSYEQYGNGNNSGITQIWYAQMVWLCIAFAAATILYLIYAAIALAVRGAKAKQVFFSRLVHMWIRMLTVAYFPLVLIAAAHTRYGGTSIVGSIIVLVLFGLGVPALSFAFTFRRGKSLFRYEWRAKFGVFYSTFHFKMPYFQLAVLARKAVLGLVIGFMAAPVAYRNQAYGQVAGAMFTMLVWIIAVAVTKPYLDKTHLLLECALNVLNIVSIGMALTHIFYPSLIGDIIFILLQIIGLLVCVGAYIHCWLAMENVNCCTPKGSKEEENTTELETHKM